VLFAVLTDTSPSQSGTVDGASWVRRLSYGARLHFNRGVTWAQPLPFDWAHFEYLAASAFGGSHAGGYKVLTEDQGGTYDGSRPTIERAT
jgi:hypothetical protein